MDKCCPIASKTAAVGEFPLPPLIRLLNVIERGEMSMSPTLLVKLLMARAMT